MLLESPIDPQAKRRQALAQVYALLIDLTAKQTVDPDASGQETGKVEDKNPEANCPPISRPSPANQTVELRITDEQK